MQTWLVFEGEFDEEFEEEAELPSKDVEIAHFEWSGRSLN